jgi:hypothetical protein
MLLTVRFEDNEFIFPLSAVRSCAVLSAGSGEKPHETTEKAAQHELHSPEAKKHYAGLQPKIP